MLSLLDSVNQLLSYVMAPFGHNAYWFDLLVWPIAMGVFALLVYKWVSNQSGIDSAKNLIKAHLIEIRIYRDDPLTVMSATGRIAIQNAKYLGFNLVPMLIMLVPMLLILVQLESQFAFAPAETGTTGLFRVTMADNVPDISTTDVQIELPQGITQDAPPVRTSDGEIYWRLRLDEPGDHILKVLVGEQAYEKVLSVGGGARKVSLMRTNQWIGFLYPGDPPLPPNSPIRHMDFPFPETELGWLPGGELGIVLWFFGLSLIAGYALKDIFGVSL